MSFTIIAAVASNGVIGNGAQLPWRIPDEFRHFKANTIGKPVLMGRVTARSVGPLRERTGFMLTRDDTRGEPGYFPIREDQLVALSGLGEVMVCGGASVYELLIPRSDKIILSKVRGDYEGDTFFPAVEWDEWELKSTLEHDRFTVLTWEKLK